MLYTALARPGSSVFTTAVSLPTPAVRTATACASTALSILVVAKSQQRAFVVHLSTLESYGTLGQRLHSLV